MREVVFKNLTSLSSRKKDIFLREVFEKDGIIAKTERRCFYYIKDIIALSKPDDLQKWLNSQSEAGTLNTRQFYIYKEHRDDLGEDRLLCKILGTFYAIVDQCVYSIAFLHSFRVRFSKATLAK